ncbi:MAG TPA: SBBP repeat-containing protein, partial [Verrucomicrobiae bacterium]|nr:SBBP repeat-containing protein [Verrucomicrobiae bacterium]
GAPSQWRTGLPTFAQVSIAGLYPGIDLVYHGNSGQLEYDFTVAAGARPDRIRLHFTGADRVSLNAAGELVLQLGGSEIVQHRPEIFQTAPDGVRHPVAGGYQLLGRDTVAFSVGSYDHRLPLVIDPVLSYGSYFGGLAKTLGWSVAVDPNDGSVYLTGETLSTKRKGGEPFATPDAFQSQFGGGKLTGDAFVAKFDSTLTNLIYCTYLGGSADDGAFSIAVDAYGDAFVTGFTDSSNFPVTPDALQPRIGGTRNVHIGLFPVDAFVSVLDPAGSNLLYSTYLGGAGADAGTGIALDGAGNIYVAGLTASKNFPVANALPGLDHLVGTNNAFVTEIASNGASFVFSTYLGGKRYDEAEGIAVDPAANIYVAGYTKSPDFPTTNAFQPLLNQGKGRFGSKGQYAADAFVTKLMPSGAGMVYSTFLGGTNEDKAFGVAADGDGDAYVVGSTGSREGDFWDTNTLTGMSGTNTIPGLRTSKKAVSGDAFLAKFYPDGSLVYSVLFGGKTNDVAYAVALDAATNVYVVGATASTNFPVYVPTNTVGFPSPDKKSRTGHDVFVTAVKADASGLLYSVYAGGKGNDFGYGVAVDGASNVYVVGQTVSTNFPAAGGFQTVRSGKRDGFLLKVGP